MKYRPRNLILTLTLAALLLAPALPTLADGGPGPLGWFTGWLQDALGWVTGDQGPCIDPFGLQESGDEAGPKIDPHGLHSGSGEEGPTIDPHGLQEDECTAGSATQSGGEHGPCIDPYG